MQNACLSGGKKQTGCMTDRFAHSCSQTNCARRQENAALPSEMQKDERDANRQSKCSREEPGDKDENARRRAEQKLDRIEGMTEMRGANRGGGGAGGDGGRGMTSVRERWEMGGSTGGDGKTAGQREEKLSSV